MWDYPRGIMTAVVPAIVRRFEAAASTTFPTGFAWSGPLNAFSSLVALRHSRHPRSLDPTWQRRGRRDRTCIASDAPVCYPGRVSYRYALSGRRERLWVTPPAASEAVASGRSVLRCVRRTGGPRRTLLSVASSNRHSLRLTTPADSISDSAYGRWHWNVAFRHDGAPLQLDIPSGSPWTPVSRDFQALTHRHRCPQTVWRYASDFDVERSSAKRTADHATQRHARRHQRPSDSPWKSTHFDSEFSMPTTFPTSEQFLRALRVARMEYLVRTNAALSASVPSGSRGSGFTKSSSQSWSSAAGAVARRCARFPVRRSTSTRLVDAHARCSVPLPSERRPVADHRIPDLSPTSPTGCKTRPWSMNSGRPRKRCGPIPTIMDDWVQERYLTTLRRARRTPSRVHVPMSARVRPAVRPQSRVAQAMKPSEGSTSRGSTWWSRRCRSARRPVRRTTRSGRLSLPLSTCDGERVDGNLRRFLTISDTTEIAEPVTRIRSAGDLAALTSGWRDLRSAMFQLGLDGDQTIISALATRIVRSRKRPRP